MSIRKSIIELLQLFMTLSTRRVSNRPWCQSRHQSQTSEWGPPRQKRIFWHKGPTPQVAFSENREKKREYGERIKWNWAWLVHTSSFLGPSHENKRKLQQVVGWMRLDEIGWDWQDQPYVVFVPPAEETFASLQWTWSKHGSRLYMYIPKVSKMWQGLGKQRAN